MQWQQCASQCAAIAGRDVPQLGDIFDYDL
jgi:hypothetical protein